MKILHFISSPAAGGAEIYVRDLVKRMSELGHDVLIVFLSDAQSIKRDNYFEEKYLKEITNSGVNYKILGNRSKKDLFLGFFRIRKIIKEFKPDIAHAHLHYALFYLGITKVKIVYTHHSIRPGVPEFLYKLYNFRVASYIAISENCQKSLKRFSGRKVGRIDNAVNIKRLKPKKQEVIFEKPSLNFLAVGRFAPFKNYEMLVDVVKELVSSSKRFKVYIAGEGSVEYKNKIVKMIDDNELQEYIKLLGQSNDMPSLFNEADVFLMTSEYEGLPIALLEATLTGLPSIVTDVGSCGEVVEKCQSGYVVKKGDSRAFAQKMYYLINHQDQCHAFSVNALKNSGYYELDRSVDQHLKVYEELI